MVDEVVKGRKGEPIGITLPGGGSMGYLWTAEAADDVAVSEGIVAQARERRDALLATGSIEDNHV